MPAPKSLIINSPYEPPIQHWEQDSGGRVMNVVPGRRSAGYEIVDTRHNTRRLEPLDLVNTIRPRVDAWRQAVNAQGGFEHWAFAVAFEPAKFREVVLAAG